ncbi:hypothetical protein PR048_027191 [Dryococelus australis]|uniref:Uncharacterized protein n=1 Tax=Dryococelus australis TaxID=614101 RepID=A0ABQ9GER8_9NEOP|nr:hypothetical protein PR048_027191 [Dryococelus australis]
MKGRVKREIPEIAFRASGIVWHDSRVRKSKGDPSVNRTRFALMTTRNVDELGSEFLALFAWDLSQRRPGDSSRLMNYGKMENGGRCIPAICIILRQDVYNCLPWRWAACVALNRNAGGSDSGLHEIQAREENKTPQVLRQVTEIYSCRFTTVVRLLTYHLGEPVSIPGGVDPGFSRVGIGPDDAAGWRVFSGISRFPRPFNQALIHTHLTLPLSALKNSTLRAAQISSLGSLNSNSPACLPHSSLQDTRSCRSPFRWSLLSLLVFYPSELSRSFTHQFPGSEACHTFIPFALTIWKVQRTPSCAERTSVIQSILQINAEINTLGSAAGAPKRRRYHIAAVLHFYSLTQDAKQRTPSLSYSENSIPAHARKIVSFARKMLGYQRQVSYSPYSIPANREPFAAFSSQSDSGPVHRDSGNQSGMMYLDQVLGLRIRFAQEDYWPFILAVYCTGHSSLQCTAQAIHPCSVLHRPFILAVYYTGHSSLQCTALAKNDLHCALRIQLCAMGKWVKRRNSRIDLSESVLSQRQQHGDMKANVHSVRARMSPLTTPRHAHKQITYLANPLKTRTRHVLQNAGLPTVRPSEICLQLICSHAPLPAIDMRDPPIAAGRLGLTLPLCGNIFAPSLPTRSSFAPIQITSSSPTPTGTNGPIPLNRAGDKSQPVEAPPRDAGFIRAYFAVEKKFTRTKVSRTRIFVALYENQSREFLATLVPIGHNTGEGGGAGADHRPMLLCRRHFLTSRIISRSHRNKIVRDVSKADRELCLGSAQFSAAAVGHRRIESVGKVGKICHVYNEILGFRVSQGSFVRVAIYKRDYSPCPGVDTSPPEARFPQRMNLWLKICCLNNFSQFPPSLMMVHAQSAVLDKNNVRPKKATTARAGRKLRQTGSKVNVWQKQWTKSRAAEKAVYEWCIKVRSLLSGTSHVVNYTLPGLFLAEVERLLFVADAQCFSRGPGDAGQCLMQRTFRMPGAKSELSSLWSYSAGEQRPVKLRRVPDYCVTSSWTPRYTTSGLPHPGTWEIKLPAIL